MSKRTEMFARIAAAMPEDAEVQEWVAKELERAGKSSAKTAERLDMAIEVLKRHVTDGEAVSAKEFAHEVNALFPGENWNTHTASYHLRQLVSKGEAEEVPNEYKKSGPKRYIYAASTVS